MLAESYGQLVALDKPHPPDVAVQCFWSFAEAPSISGVLVDGSVVVNSPTAVYSTNAIWSRSGSFNDSGSQANLFADLFLNGLRSWVNETTKLSQRDFWNFSSVVLFNSPIEWTAKTPFESGPLIDFDLIPSTLDVTIAVSGSTRLLSDQLWHGAKG
jgi:hypothetical protein